NQLEGSMRFAGWWLAPGLPPLPASRARRNGNPDSPYIRFHVNRLVLFFLHADRVAWRAASWVLHDAEITFLPRDLCPAGGCIGVGGGPCRERRVCQQENEPGRAWHPLHIAS